MGSSKELAREAVASMAIEFVAKSKDLVKALRFVRTTNLKGQREPTEFIEVKVSETEVEFAASTVLSSFPAQVVRQGSARAPVWLFEWFRKVVSSLHRDSVRISVVDGQLRIENLTYTHAEIAIS